MRFRPHLVPGEYVVTCNRAHPLKLLWPALVLLCGIFCSSFLQVVSSENRWWSWAAALVLIVAVGYTGSKSLRWLLTWYALTDRKIVIRYGVGAGRAVEVPLETVSDVRVVHRALSALRGCGTVHVAVPGRSYVLTYQKNPGKFVEMCSEYRARRYRTQLWR